MTDWFDGLTPKERLTWLAGVVDSEGCFDRIMGNKISGGGYPRVQIAMNDLDTMQRVVIATAEHTKIDLPEDALRPNELPSGKTQYKLVLYGDDALAVMRLLSPIMSSRRAAKIDEIIRMVS